jgi:hypothetical protein
MAALAEPEEVRAHLVAAAKAGEPITYAGLLELLGFLSPARACASCAPCSAKWTRSAPP